MNLLNLEEEKLKTVDVLGNQFTIRYMSPLDRIRITQGRLSLQNGNSIESLTQEDFMFFENIAIVNVCVEKFPDDFPYKKYESCAKWDDIELIHALAGEIRKHTNDIEEKLKKNRLVDGGSKK
jgi:hypothetical protein